MRRALEVVALTAGIGALSLLCWHFGLGELAAALGRLTPSYLGVYLICGCVARLGCSLRWQAVARSLGDRPDLARLVGARVAADAVGSVLPTGRIGGDPVRVALVYGEYASGSRAAAGVAIDRIIEVISNTVCAIAYVATFSHAHAAAPSYQAQTLLVTMSVLLILLAIPLATLRRGSSPFAPLSGLLARRSATWAAALLRIEAHLISFFRDHPGTLVRALLGSLVIEAFMVGEFFFLLAAFGLTLDLPTLLMAMVAGGVARVVPTPGGLGAVEASQVGVLAFAAGRPDIGFVIGMVLRVHETFWIAIGMVAFSLQGSSLARLRLLVAARKSAV